MFRLVVQFKSDHPFGGPLELLGLYKDVNEAIEDGLSVTDHTVEAMLVRKGSQALRIV